MDQLRALRQGGFYLAGGMLSRDAVAGKHVPAHTAIRTPQSDAKTAPFPADNAPPPLKPLLPFSCFDVFTFGRFAG